MLVRSSRYAVLCFVCTVIRCSITLVMDACLCVLRVCHPPPPPLLPYPSATTFDILLTERIESLLLL